MKINKIVINKFRKLENIVEENVGLINELYGSNGSGKTSYISFISWMLFGETLDYGKNDDMNIDTFKPYEVISGSIILEDGTELSRKFGYDESGKKIQEFYINERKVKKQEEYYNKVYECFNLTQLNNLKIKNFNLLKALSDPYYLPNNENQFRDFINAILNVDIYGILFEMEKYNDIREDFYNQGFEYDNCKEYYNQKLKSLESELLVLNTIIQESSNIVYNEKEVEELKQKLITLNSNQIEDKKELLEIMDKIAIVSSSLIESRKNDLLNPIKSEVENKLEELKDKYNKVYYEYEKLYTENKTNNTKKVSLTSQIDLLENELKKIKESKFENHYCPNCNFLLNEEDYKVFNKNKVEKTKQLKATIENLTKELNEIKMHDLTSYEEQMEGYLKEINALKEIILDKPTSYISEDTKRLENEYNELYQEYQKLKQENEIEKQNIIQEINNKKYEIEDKLMILENNRIRLSNRDIAKSKKQNILNIKSVYELKLSLLNEFKINEIQIIKNKTKEIFGEDFEFEMLVKNKSNDNYKKVCYASIDGLEHSKSNTAKYLKYSIMLLEKLKKYIGNCDIPIIFDIVDNIGEKTRKEIFDLIKNSQIFYTRICDKDGVERTLNIIKKVN